jgi:tripartite-type tricarboxylate transporter receptor subunit TctC
LRPTDHVRSRAWTNNKKFGEEIVVASRSFMAGLCLLSAAAIAESNQASAQTQDFYSGKQLNIVVGFTAGGGYDITARLYARHFSRFIPGAPPIIVTNMPGAGSMVAANTLFNDAKADGTRIGMITGGIILAPILGDPQARFDSRKFQYIGGRSAEPSVCVVSGNVPVSSIDDLRKTEVIVGASGPGSRTYAFPKALNTFAGTHFKTVVGYPGGNETATAMERGEVQAFCGWAWASAKVRAAEWIKSGQIRILAQFALVKSPDLPNVPLAGEFATTTEGRKAIEFLESDAALAWPMFAPPVVPKDRVEILRHAFDAMMKDPEFLADAGKQKLDVDPVSGVAMQDLIDGLYQTPKPVLEALRNVLAE